MGKQVMTIHVLPNRIELRKGQSEKAHPSYYHHPEVEFYIIWETSNRKNRYPAINQLLTTWLQLEHMSISALRFSQTSRQAKVKPNKMQLRLWDD